MSEIAKATAIKNASILETCYRIHCEAVANAESKARVAIALEESSKALLKEYAVQNDPTLFPDGVATAKISGDVIVQRRSGVTTYDFSKIGKADREYLMATYPNAFAKVMTINIDHRKLRKDDVDTARLLAQVDYEEVLSTVHSVSTSTVE